MTKPYGYRSDPWEGLRRFTAARIALGRAGGSVPTNEMLRFQMHHARAIDAVYADFDVTSVMGALEQDGRHVLAVSTRATDRLVFLQRPDYGRRLDDESRERLTAYANGTPSPDVIIAVVDGLSGPAVNRHAVPVIQRLVPTLTAERITVGPIVLVRQGRVALQDEIGAALGARVVVSLIGERPGLGTPDSLGAYLVYDPRPGATDANRNCVSNIRPEGLPYEAAAGALHWLITESLRRKISGVQLKDDRQLVLPTAHEALPHEDGGSNPANTA